MGFEQIKAIRDANREARMEEATRERTECPICTWPLDKNDDGILNCPFGHWTSAPKLPKITY